MTSMVVLSGALAFFLHGVGLHDGGHRSRGRSTSSSTCCILPLDLRMLPLLTSDFSPREIACIIASFLREYALSLVDSIIMIASMLLNSNHEFI